MPYRLTKYRLRSSSQWCKRDFIIIHVPAHVALHHITSCSSHHGWLIKLAPLRCCVVHDPHTQHYIISHHITSYFITTMYRGRLIYVYQINLFTNIQVSQTKQATCPRHTTKASLSLALSACMHMCQLSYTSQHTPAWARIDFPRSADNSHVN